jgi:RHS repeat-associated protein
VRGDIDLDADVDSIDKTIASESPVGGIVMGWDMSSSNSIRNRRGSTGRELRLEGQSARLRLLKPRLGWWTVRDPLFYSDGLNVYSYVRSSPLVHTDPFGASTGGQCINCELHQEEDCCKAVSPYDPRRHAEVVCCEGQPIICWYSSPIEGPAFAACVQAHEESHLEDAVCDGKTNGGIPGTKAGISEAASEAKAYGVSADCLRNIDCNGNQDCERAKEKKIRSAERRRDWYECVDTHGSEAGCLDSIVKELQEFGWG